MRMRRRDGVAFEARASAIAIGDEILWTIADQTLLAQAEEQVWQLNRELEERVAERTAELEALLEQLPVGVALVTRLGSVTWLNTRGQNITGSRANTLDQLFADGATSPDGRELERSQYPAARAQRGEYVHAVRLATKRADGRPLTLEVTAVPLGAGGVVVVFDDVTDQARREEAERRFVSNAAHQIRTPITIISSIVAALQAGGRDDPEALDRFIAHIDGAVTRLAGLAEALLTLARIQRGGERPMEIVPLLPVVDEVVAGRDIETQVEEELAVVGNRALVVEALSNIVDNAFVHGGGVVEIAARSVGGRTIVDVRDHGGGIAKEDRARALERFATGGRGAGLGLPIAHEAALALDGTMTLDEAEGGGLLVRFELPGATLL
jgi:PAS domain S-box-containing protein